MPFHLPQARETELAEMLGSTQSSLEAMQRLYGAAQNQLFELQSNKEAAVVVKQVGRPVSCVSCLSVSHSLL